MKLLKIALAVLLVLVSVLYGITTIRTSNSGKSVGPTISCASDTLEVSVSAGEAELLAGVTASDRQDGDLTGEVRVLAVSKFTTPGTAKITYVVFDKDHNMATVTRKLQYTDYTSPVFTITQPLIYGQNATIELLDRIRVTDVIDGDITHAVRVSLKHTTSYPEVYTVDVQVTNSMGDTVQLTLPIICQESTLNRAEVRLSSYLTYIDAGSPFDPNAYLIAVETPDGYGYTRDVQISGTVDTHTPGTYQVFYSYRDENFSGTSILTVVVQ